uniref:Mutator-like transposase domain-containing protein n=1 Tax=Amphimedon queenslandica TaxID=400682 RepID=A0A1X7TXK2_AMPQE
MGIPIVMGGDGRADSPGYSAKNGSYTPMDLNRQMIVSIELVQSNKVSGSPNMEKEGLIRTFKFFENTEVRVGTLVTDRHSGIAKFIREKYPQITYCYDGWHVAKSLRKKIEKLVKEKDCGIVGEWLKSIVNHLYWSAVSTPSGNSDVILAKWLSLDNHIQNKHSHSSKHFKKCLHRRITRCRKWLKRHTKPSENLTKIIVDKRFCNSVKKLSPVYQTSKVEAFHSVVLHFAPKLVSFSYNGMLTRLRLAALHYNENSARLQSKTKSGENRFSISYPKYKKGGYIVRKIMDNPTYDYVKVLFQLAIENLEKSNRATSLTNVEPTPLCANYEHPNKEDAIKKHQSRFSM